MKVGLPFPGRLCVVYGVDIKATSMILGLLLLQVLGCAGFAGWVRQYVIAGVRGEMNCQ
jgi:hypothetical protein